MEIFIKTLTSIDIERGLQLPDDAKLEALPSFGGGRAIVFPIRLEQAGEMEVKVHCDISSSGKVAFTKGWCDIVRHLRLNSGDVVTCYKEMDNGSAQYKMRVRSASCGSNSKEEDNSEKLGGV